MIQIDTTGRILLDGQPCGLATRQTDEGTQVYTPEDVGPYRVHAMPAARYSLAHDNPASGAPGRAQFERDVRALLASEAT